MLSYGSVITWNSFFLLQPCFRRDLDNKLDFSIDFSVFKLVHLIFERFYLQCSFEALGQTSVSGPILVLDKRWLFVQHGQQGQALLMWYFLYNFSVKAFVCPFHKYCMHPNPTVFSLSEAQTVFMVPEAPKSLSLHLPPSASHHLPLPVPEMGSIIPMAAWLHQCWCQAGFRQEQTLEHKAGHSCQWSLTPY